MRRRIAVIALAAAVLYGGFFMAVHRALDSEDWPEW